MTTAIIDFRSGPVDPEEEQFYSWLKYELEQQGMSFAVGSPFSWEELKKLSAKSLTVCYEWPNAIFTQE